MKNKNPLLLSCLFVFFVINPVSAEFWPVYYQPTAGPSTPTPLAACKDRLIGSYGDQRDYEAGFHTGVDIGVPDNNQALEYAVYPATIEATVVDIHEESYKTYILTQTRAGDLYAYGHIIPDPNLIKGQTVYPVGYPGHPYGTILGRIQITDGFSKPNSHLHFTQWASKDEDVPIRNPLNFLDYEDTIRPQVGYWLLFRTQQQYQIGN